MKNKQASILLEVIFSIMLLSIVTVSAMLIYKEFFKLNRNEFNIEINKIELLNTKYFLQKKLNFLNDTTKLTFSNSNLYFDNHLLLNNVSSYNVKSTSSSFTMNICLKDKICKEFLFLL